MCDIKYGFRFDSIRNGNSFVVFKQRHSVAPESFRAFKCLIITDVSRCSHNGQSRNHLNDSDEITHAVLFFCSSFENVIIATFFSGQEVESRWMARNKQTKERNSHSQFCSLFQIRLVIKLINKFAFTCFSSSALDVLLCLRKMITLFGKEFFEMGYGSGHQHGMAH